MTIQKRASNQNTYEKSKQGSIKGKERDKKLTIFVWPRKKFDRRHVVFISETLTKMETIKNRLKINPNKNPILVKKKKNKAKMVKMTHNYSKWKVNGRKRLKLDGC